MFEQFNHPNSEFWRAFLFNLREYLRALDNLSVAELEVFGFKSPDLDDKIWIKCIKIAFQNRTCREAAPCIPFPESWQLSIDRNDWIECSTPKKACRLNGGSNRSF